MKPHLPLILKKYIAAATGLALTCGIYADSINIADHHFNDVLNGNKTFILYENYEPLVAGIANKPLFDGNANTGAADYDLSFTTTEGSSPYSLKLINERDLSIRAIWAENVSFSEIGDITFANFSVSPTYPCKGGAIYAFRSIDFTDTGNITFNGNHVSDTDYAYGGAIFTFGSANFENTGNIEFIKNYAASPSYAYGGAICAERGLVAFTNTGHITFSQNYTSHSYNSHGGAIYAAGGLLFENTGDIAFSNNSTGYSYSSNGGALYAQADINFKNTGIIQFDDNGSTASYYAIGGAIYTYGNVNFENTREIIFANNFVESRSPSSLGGAIFAGGRISFNDTADITFTNNRSTGTKDATSAPMCLGGAIYTSKSIVFNKTGDLTFSGNRADTLVKTSSLASGGAIFAGEYIHFTNIGNIVFEGNSAFCSYSHSTPYGGALYADSDVLFKNTKNVLFSNNDAGTFAKYSYSSTKGGAIYAAGNINFENTENVIFDNNRSLSEDYYGYTYGGALYSGKTITLAKINGDAVFINNKSVVNPNSDITRAHGGAIYSEGGINLSADGGDIIFTGNIIGSDINDSSTWIANGIEVVGQSGKQAQINTIRAKNGRTIAFFDPVIAQVELKNDPATPLNLNQGTGYYGTILFSGSKLDHITNETNKEISSFSQINRSAILHSGKLIVENGAKLEFNSLEVLQYSTIKGNGTLTSTNGIVVKGSLSPDGYTHDWNENDRLTLNGTNIGTLTITGNLDLQNAAIDIDLAKDNRSDCIAIEGNLSSNSSGIIHLLSWDLGQFTIMTAPGSINPAQYGIHDIYGLGPRIQMTLDGSTDRELILTTSATDDRHNLIFSGLEKEWCTTVNGTWARLRGAQSENFLDGDHVLFRDSGWQRDILVTENGVVVSGMIVSDGHYSFSGGSITGVLYPESYQDVTGELDIYDKDTFVRFENRIDFVNGMRIRYGATVEVFSHSIDGLDVESFNSTIKLMGDGCFRFGNMDNAGLIYFENLGNTLSVNNLSGEGIISLEVDMERGIADTIRVEGNVSGHQQLILRATSAPATDEAIAPITLVTALNNAGEGTISGNLDYGAYNYDVMSLDGNKTWQLMHHGSYSSAAQSIVNTIGSMSTGWFSQLDNLSKRMGEIRLGSITKKTAGHKGIEEYSIIPKKGDFWVRGYGSQVNTDLGISGMSSFREYQYGADMGVDKIFSINHLNDIAVGLFTGWQGSDRRFRDGFGSSGDSNSIYGGIYTTWLHKDGWYADAVIKGQHNDNSYHARGYQGEFETAGLGFSLELGRQIQLKKGWFIEPGIQFAYLHTSSQSFMASDIPVHAASSDIYRFAGMMRAGKTFTLPNGMLMQPYLKAGIEDQVSQGGSVKVASDKLNPNTDGCRGLAGAGLIWQITGHSQIHADYEYSYGDKYDRPWTVNLGYRYSF